MSDNKDALIYLADVRIDELKVENEKLRELVWRLLEVDRIGATSNEWREIRELARELGVVA